MNIDSIKNGYVIDHIKAGKGMEIYNLLRLDLLDCPVAIIKNASSSKMGKKDIIKIDALIELNMDILGYVSPDATVDIIKDEKLVEKKKMSLPEKLTNVIFCKNPRCITTTEQELPHIFHLTDKTEREYRCVYCESKGN
ncbi:MAG: aspartate carbamoyltransferase regulatory subunit [Clostridia bacterium]|nr:aspartate carbamoyltransferase regulatory subunit [Oscillospiraceae bacterium]MBQ7959688.1 aspartate carbamoyltransferase regulatory subunit [Clostridia bacterium]